MNRIIAQEQKEKNKGVNVELPARKYGARPEISAKQKRELSIAFGIFDPRGSGLIDRRPFLLSLRALGYHPTFQEVDDMIQEFTSRSYNESLDFKDYYNLMDAKMTEDERKEDINLAFKMFSNPETGLITLENITAIANELEEDISEEKLKEMISFADKKNDGTVNFEEFSTMMERPELE